MDASRNYVFIVAGGAGTRLWPVSRQKSPKQFQTFVGDETMLQHMAALSARVVPEDHVFVMATPEFTPIIREQLPNLPEKNLLFEPARRDNGPAITLGMMQIHKRDPRAVVAILWADHLIQQPDTFVTTVKAALSASQDNPDSLVTIGAKPLYPDPALGYIQMGKEIESHEGVPVFRVKKFIEKPDLATATRYVASWEYLWNVGYKIMGTQQFLTAFERVQPGLKPVLERLEGAVAANDQAAIADAYGEFPKLSIEHNFTPFLTDLLVVPGDLGWSDIGSWNVLHDVLKAREGGDFVSRGEVINVGSSNSLVFAKGRPIATVGIKNLIVVDDGDAVLVMDRGAGQDIKKAVALLEETHKELL